MPDITMCRSTTCENSKNCYRHEATPSYRQSITDFSHGKDVEVCDYFVQIRADIR